MGRDFISNSVHVGLSIGIVARGEPRQFHFGSIDRRHGVAPTGRTIYELASLTKTYTGMLLAQAVVDDKIALDDDVRRYLPPGFANLAFDGQPIRIVDLASHTAGLPKNLPAFPTGSHRGNWCASKGMFRVRRSCMRWRRYDWQYGRVPCLHIRMQRRNWLAWCSNVSTVCCDALLRRAITGPHRMPDTGTVVAPREVAREVARYARRYDGRGRVMPEMTFWRSLPAAGFLKSTIDDQLRYLAWNLDASDPAVALTHRVVFRHTGERGDDIGLFWFVNRTRDGMRLVRHAGGSFGTTSFELLYPDAGIGVVLLANDADASTEQALSQMAIALAEALAQ